MENFNGVKFNCMDYLTTIKFYQKHIANLEIS